MLLTVWEKSGRPGINSMMLAAAAGAGGLFQSDSIYPASSLKEYGALALIMVNPFERQRSAVSKFIRV
jgi:hypothetical protein